MKITIWSHWRGDTWTGDVPDLEGESMRVKLEIIFAMFNRVDIDQPNGLNPAALDLETIGYRLPSLSVLDTVTFENGETWICSVFGWVQEGTPEEAADELLAIHRKIEGRMRNV